MAPLLAYVLIAALCWIVPTRVLSVEDQLLNVYPVRVLGFVSAVLASVHWSLFLRGRFVLVAALCWAFATASLATFFAASMIVGITGWELMLNTRPRGWRSPR